MNRSLPVLAIVVLALSACGGGDGPVLSQEEIDQVRSDPRIVSASRIIERADTLLIPAVEIDVSLTAQGHTESRRVHMRGSCRGTYCDLSGDGEYTTVTLDDLLAPGEDIEFSKINLGSRRGFSTADIEGRSRLSERIVSGSITVHPTTRASTFWGEWGLASIESASGPISGTVQGTSFRGRLTAIMPYAVGDASGYNPQGFGGATWHGISGAVSTRTYQHRYGTATISIPDLQRPLVNVDIEIAGFAIGSSAWDRIPLRGGRYETGYSGEDKVVGNFHGSRNQETYGVFDTGAYIGSFAAKRQ